MDRSPARTGTPNEAVVSALTEQIRACRLCREAPLRQPLPHEPRPVVRASATARILIAGQAPGTRVHASGIPFTDPSGDRLRQWLDLTPEVFYDRSRIAIVPMGFCFPGQDAKGGDLPPRPECAPKWREAVIAAMPQVELVIAIGQYAQHWHLGSDNGPTLTATVADWARIVARDVHPTVLPLPHPSWRNSGWLKRHPWFATDLLPEVQARVRGMVEGIAGN